MVSSCAERARFWRAELKDPYPRRNLCGASQQTHARYTLAPPFTAGYVPTEGAYLTYQTAVYTKYLIFHFTCLRRNPRLPL